MGRVEGKVVLIIGAARGQGRHHAIRLAEAGADVILLDICADIPGVGYPMATPEDLDETVRLVKKFGRRAIAAVVDVRDRPSLQKAVASAVYGFGRLDVVVANAGICPIGVGYPVPEDVLLRNRSGEPSVERDRLVVVCLRQCPSHGCRLRVLHHLTGRARGGHRADVTAPPEHGQRAE